MDYYKAIDTDTGWFLLIPVQDAIVTYQVMTKNEPTWWVRTAIDSRRYPLVVEKKNGFYRFADTLREATITERSGFNDVRLP